MQKCRPQASQQVFKRSFVIAVIVLVELVDEDGRLVASCLDGESGVIVNDADHFGAVFGIIKVSDRVHAMFNEVFGDVEFECPQVVSFLKLGL